VSRPTRVTKLVPITLELVIEASAELCPAEPDVGLTEPYLQDIEVLRIGDETQTVGDKVEWWTETDKLAHVGYNHDIRQSILAQCESTITERLFDDAGS
jgi:hypothetical protein